MTNQLRHTAEWIKWPRNVAFTSLWNGDIRERRTYHKYVCPYAFNLYKPVISTLYIFTDIIKPVVVNEDRLQILQMVDMGKETQISHVVFPLHFHAINGASINQIKIWIQ